MNDPDRKNPVSCPGHCPSCSQDRGGENPACAQSAATYVGWRLGLASAVAFVVPVLAAIAVAVGASRLAGGTWSSVLAALGAVLGLVVGALAAGPVVVRLQSNKELA